MLEDGMGSGKLVGVAEVERNEEIHGRGVADRIDVSGLSHPIDAGRRDLDREIRFLRQQLGHDRVLVRYDLHHDTRRARPSEKECRVGNEFHRLIGVPAAEPVRTVSDGTSRHGMGSK